MIRSSLPFALIGLVLLAILAGGCGRQEEPPSSILDRNAPTNPVPPVGPDAPGADGKPDAAPAIGSLPVDADIGPDTRVSFKHILITYSGAEKADPRIERDKDEAYSIILDLEEHLKRYPEKFEELAGENSDEVGTGRRGGQVPPDELRTFFPVFQKAVAGLKPGQISGIVESRFGFHLIKREPLEEAILQSILISFQGAVQAGTDIGRTAAEAEEKAREIHGRISSGKASFNRMALLHSQDPWAGRFGYMTGVVTRGSIPYDEINRAAFALKEGELSNVFRSPLGYHILKRHKIEARQASQVVVLYGAERSKARARQLIQQAYRDWERGRAFPELIETYSDQDEKDQGFGPVVFRGTWTPRLEERLFNMKLLEVTEPIELSTAFVILVRVR
ncbi:peptidylprolyl isomerase [Planctomycetota bacterium]